MLLDHIKHTQYFYWLVFLTGESLIKNGEQRPHRDPFTCHQPAPALLCMLLSLRFPHSSSGLPDCFKQASRIDWCAEQISVSCSDDKSLTGNTLTNYAFPLLIFKKSTPGKVPGIRNSTVIIVAPLKEIVYPQKSDAVEPPIVSNPPISKAVPASTVQ